MRMAGPDIVLFVVGALLFGGATYAIVAQEGGLGGSASALGIFQVHFEGAESELAREPVQSFRSASAEFAVEALNVTRVLVSVECADPASSAVAFTLQVSVTGPNGIAPDPVSGACGQELVVEVPLAELPGETTAQGTTEAEARANLPTFENAELAVGTWNVEVTGARANAPLALPVGDPSGAIVLSVETWEPHFTPVQR